MAIGKSLAIMLSASTAISGMLLTNQEFKQENLYNIKSNFNIVEKTLKTNEAKLVDKYNELYENANTNIENLETTNQELISEIEKITLEYKGLLDKNQNSNNEINKLKEQLKSKDEYIKQLEGKINDTINNNNNSSNNENIDKEAETSKDEVEQEVIIEENNDTSSEETAPDEVKLETE